MARPSPPLLALLLALPLLVSPTLSVYNLQALGENEPELLDIPYSVANFGFVPYCSLTQLRQDHRGQADGLSRLLLGVLGRPQRLQQLLYMRW